jgi:WD40 repeat protein/GTPase SAR1 family protein
VPDERRLLSFNTTGFREIDGVSLKSELVRALRGDESRINVVAWSPDGGLLATGSFHRIRVWDLANDMFSDFEVNDTVYSLAWSPDGQLLASGRYGTNAVSIWEFNTGQVWRSIGGPAEEEVDGGGGASPSIAWSPSTGAIAVGHLAGAVEIWDSNTWKPRSLFPGHRNSSSQVAWAPDGILLGVGGYGNIQVWDARAGERQHTLETSSDDIHSIAWSADGRRLASGSDDGAVLLWDLYSNAVQRLEGHVESVKCVRISRDGKLLASLSSDNTVRLWNAASGELLDIIGSAWKSPAVNGMDFHPSRPQLAAIDEAGTGVCIWQWDLEQLIAGVAEAVRYTTARIVLLGDSGVGKTGLGWRLAHGSFKEHPSTHGQQFWTLDQLGARREDGVQCEAVLWDLAGQPDYRLVHSLFLDTIDLALLLIDPANRQDPLAGVDYWLGHLQDGKSESPSIILVGARTDRGTPTLTESELAAVSRRLGIFGGYIATSAKDGDGLEELLARIKSLIPWESLSATVTTTTFKRMRDYILSLKETVTYSGVLVSASTLRQRLEETDPNWRFSDAEMIAAARHLETHGYVKILRNTSGDEFILLAPDVLSNLASSIVLEARREPHGLGALDEARLLEGDYRLPELDDLDYNERRILLDAVVLLFVEHNVCFREYLGSRVLLVFPSLINEQRPLISDVSVVEDTSYAISGAVENVYAALVVLLGYTNTFTRTDQWQNQAQYELGDGEICGFRQIDEGKGAVALVLHYGMSTPDNVKRLFQGLFETFLTRRNINIMRYWPVICDAKGCGEHQDRTVAIKQIGRGKDLIYCANCGAKVYLPRPDDLMVLATRNTEVQDQKQIADQRTAFEAAVVRVKSLLLERGEAQVNPSCFISYAWGVPTHERWVVQLAKDLRNAGIDVLLDRWHSPPGYDLGRYIDRISNSQFVIVVGTPELLQKYETNSTDQVVAAELELIGLRLRQPGHYGPTVVPILLGGTAREAFTPMLEKLVNIDFREDELYFTQLLTMIWKLCSLPFDHPLLEELQASMTSAVPWIQHLRGSFSRSGRVSRKLRAAMAVRASAGSAGRWLELQEGRVCPPRAWHLVAVEDHCQGRTSSLRCGHSTLTVIFHGKRSAPVRRTNPQRGPPGPKPPRLAGHSETARLTPGNNNSSRHAPRPAPYASSMRTGRGAVTPTTDTNGAGCHDPLSDVRTLFSQLGDHIGQLCATF